MPKINFAKAILIFFPLLVYADARITFAIRYYPELDQAIDMESLQQNVKDPSRLIQRIMRTSIPTSGVSGIMITYAGFTTISSLEGQVDLPRRQQKTSFHVLVSLDIEPVMMAGTTVYYWALLPDAKASLYHIEMQQDDETKRYFWNVEAVPLPDDNVVPLDTIILFTKPQNIYIPEGITLTRKTANLILPDIYAKKGTDFWSDAFNFLQIKHFFRTIRKIDHQYNPTYWSNQLKL